MTGRRCQGCGIPIAIEGPIRRRDCCPSCGADLHACVQCRFYDPSVSNQCRESQAERVQDKEGGNFCEFFQLLTGPTGAAIGSADSKADDARAKLEALFKK